MASSTISRRLPIGAEVENRGAHFRVWAPRSNSVKVVLGRTPELKDGVFPLASEGNGYFSGLVPDARAGHFYKYRLDSGVFPDPASRFQPEGPHGPSQIVDPGTFHWTDADWQGVSPRGQVIYEMHVGTFTREGTFAAAMRELPELAELGVTMVELMPLAAFAGRFGWGYDGVDLYAPTQLYGEPDDFRAFVNRAHELGLAVILDVVFNHFGPDGCYLGQFSDHYTTDRYPNEWGEAIDFDGPESAPAREFFIQNCVYWIEEFHVDGFRFDAVQQIYDRSAQHILAEIAVNVRKVKPALFLSVENDLRQGFLLRPPEEGGCGLDATWNDDFHHAARVALTGRGEAYYMDFRGTPQELISCMKWGFLYQGQWSRGQGKSKGTPCMDLSPTRFVAYLENHDQVANSLLGRRLHQLSAPALYRAVTALFLLGPGTPLLFQGQEFGSSAPFLYFADHHADLAKQVTRGRWEFLCRFPSIASPEARGLLQRPDLEETFRACKLDFAERQSHAAHYRLYRDLLRLRKSDPVFSSQHDGFLDGAVLGQGVFLLRFFGGEAGDRLMIVNLGTESEFDGFPEPLIAPPQGEPWKLLWSSESPIYGGMGTPEPEWSGAWRIPGQLTLVFGS